MKRTIIISTIRLIFTAALLILVFRETGPWTTITLGLLCITQEISYFSKLISKISDNALNKEAEEWIRKTSKTTRKK